MLDMEYMKQVLQVIRYTSYQGIENGDLIDEVVGKDSSDDEFLKFKYHMDEMWDAGLIKGRDGPGENGWGYKGIPPRIMFISVQLVLSPIGSELLEELKKPKGLERLKQAVRNVGGAAGTEALKFGIGEMLRGSVS